jgi:hypothetical protein
VLTTLIASGKFRHRVDVASLGGLCCMVVVGPRTLRRDGLRDSNDCAIRAQEVETSYHLLLGCVHSRETWFRILHYYGLQHLTPQEGLPFFEWWLATRKQVNKFQQRV